MKQKYFPHNRSFCPSNLKTCLRACFLPQVWKCRLT